MSRPAPSGAAVPGSVRSAFARPAVLRTEVLSGLVVALALIPEAIAFSIIAGSTRGSGSSPRSRWP
ncbi:hypothetical protein [Pseudonocardia terrae]|uniref:hypothetical protein n=1 Tax=Pseudonocardia terrae TaxID=2905831 RepID=UPI00355895C1